MSTALRILTGLALGVAVLGDTGCGKKAGAGDQAIAPTSAPAPTSVPAPAQVSQGAPSPGPTEPATDLGMLTQALRRFSVERRKVPQNLGEVVAAGYLRGLPPAPAGKQFEIDPKTLEVILVSQ